MSLNITKHGNAILMKTSNVRTIVREQQKGELHLTNIPLPNTYIDVANPLLWLLLRLIISTYWNIE